MTAPITPDERAAMRERYEPGPMGSPERIDIERKASQGHSARADVPRLLDALDTAEAEVARLRAARPDREDIYRAWHGTDDPWGGCADSASIERVLDLWPGESRAQVEAAAPRDAVEKYAITIPDALGYKVPAVTTEDLLDRADRLDPKEK